MDAAMSNYSVFNDLGAGDLGTMDIDLTGFPRPEAMSAAMVEALERQGFSPEAIGRPGLIRSCVPATQEWYSNIPVEALSDLEIYKTGNNVRTAFNLEN